jgi:hypothetical protein
MSATHRVSHAVGNANRRKDRRKRLRGRRLIQTPSHETAAGRRQTAAQTTCMTV